MPSERWDDATFFFVEEELAPTAPPVGVRLRGGTAFDPPAALPPRALAATLLPPLLELATCGELARAEGLNGVEELLPRAEGLLPGPDRGGPMSDEGRRRRSVAASPEGRRTRSISPPPPPQRRTGEWS